MSMSNTIAELKDMVKEHMEKLFPDDWEDRFDELSVKMPKKEWLAKLNELNRAIHPAQYALMDVCTLESNTKKAEFKSKDLANELGRMRKQLKDAEDRAKAFEKECDKKDKDLASTITEMHSQKGHFIALQKEHKAANTKITALKNEVKELKAADKQGGGGRYKRKYQELDEKYDRLQDRADEQEETNEELQAAYDKLKVDLNEAVEKAAKACEERDQANAGRIQACVERDEAVNRTKTSAHAGSLQEDLKKKNEENMKLKDQMAELEKTNYAYFNELQPLRALRANLCAQDDIHKFMNKFRPELHKISNVELKHQGDADKKDFSTYLTIKVREEDYNDDKYSYVTLNSRLILEKVLLDTMLYERMLQELGVEKGKWVHHKPHADHAARNERTLKKAKEIWGVGLNPGVTNYTVLSN